MTREQTLSDFILSLIEDHEKMRAQFREFELLDEQQYGTERDRAKIAEARREERLAWSRKGYLKSYKR